MKKINFIIIFLLIISLYAKADEIITSDVTWTVDHHVAGNLIIKDGATLTVIPGVVVEMEVYKYIEVWYESALIANGATFTASCNNWFGMFTRGYGNDYDQVYFLNTDNEKQPSITLTDCTIEKMQYGINSSTITGNINENTGGILRIKGCTFNDNNIGIRFYHFTHMRGSSVARDISYIYDTKFNDVNVINSKSIYMQHAVGIRIYGCEFNSTSGSMTAVTSSTSSFTIDDYYTNAYLNPTLISESKFINCNTGVRATSSSSYFGKSVIKNSYFDNNDFAILGFGTDNIEIYSNEIDIVQDASNDKKSGIYVEGGNQFLITNNTVEAQNSAGGFPTNTWGIVAHNSGELNNEIYSNTVDNCEFSIAGQEKNRGSLAESGLKFICNNFTQSTTAALASDNSYYMSALTNDGADIYNGVNRMQSGGGLLSSGIINPLSSCFNTISPRPALINTEYDFLNENNAKPDIIYMEPNANSTFVNGDINHYSENVWPMKAGTVANSRCPSKTPNYWWQSPVTSVDDISNEMVSISGLIAAEEGAKSSYINNGDYDYMLNSVNTITAYNYIYVYYDLMNNHPSHDIIAIAVANDILPTYMVKDILMTNTYGIKSEAVRTALNLRQNQLSSTDMTDINTASETISQYETYIMNLSSYKTQLQTLKAERYNYVYNENLGEVEDENQEINVELLSEILMDNNDYYSYLKLMMANFEDLNKDEMEKLYNEAINTNVSDSEKENLDGLYQVLLNTIENYEGDFTQMDVKDVEELYSIIKENSKVSVIAKSILEDYFEYEITPTLLKPTRSSNRIANNNIINSNYSNMKIVPNPAINYFGIIVEDNFEYPLQLSVYDISGKLVISKEINNINTISTDNLKNGAYQIKITDSNNKVFTQKLLISK